MKVVQLLAVCRGPHTDTLYALDADGRVWFRTVEFDVTSNPYQLLNVAEPWGIVPGLPWYHADRGSGSAGECPTCGAKPREACRVVRDRSSA
jgi:hypothetical protein